MKSSTPQQRPYQEVGVVIRDLIVQTPYQPGKRLPPEREIAKGPSVTRTVMCETLIMLEVKGLVGIRRGAGIYVLDNAEARIIDSSDVSYHSDTGPFELLQARQLLESNIAEFAMLQTTREDTARMYRVLQLEERELVFSEPSGSKNGDMQFYLAVTEATHDSMLMGPFRQSWQWHENGPTWIQLHNHLGDTHYRKEWMGGHRQVLAALTKKDAYVAKLVIWQHLENVKQRLLGLSNVDDVDFDDYLFDS